VDWCSPFWNQTQQNWSKLSKAYWSAISWILHSWEPCNISNACNLQTPFACQGYFWGNVSSLKDQTNMIITISSSLVV
jgi:hypothetical protein